MTDNKLLRNPSTQIKMLCTKNHITKRRLAECLRINEMYFYTMNSNFEKKFSLPKIEMLIPICEFFNVTLDDFLFTDYCTQEPNYVQYCGVRTLAEQLPPLCVIKGVSIDDALFEMGFSPSYYQQICRNTFMPRTVTAMTIAGYFGISLHDLFYKDWWGTILEAKLEANDDARG